MVFLDRADSRARATTEQTRTPQSKATTFDQPLWQLAGVIASPEQPLTSREAVLERRADETRALLAAIVESSDDAILSIDLNGIITSWNKGARHVFGYTAEEVIGRSTSTLASENCQEDWAHILEKIRNGDRVDHYETFRRHKDGSEIAVSLTVSPIHDAEGELIGASKVARDITGTRLTEAALRNADKLALAGRMAASIAHEINNPLEAITNLLFLLDHEPLPEQARRYLTLAQHEVTRVSHIASQTLGFFRGAPGSTATPLADIIDSAVSLHIGRLATCNVVVEKDYGSAPSIFCNQGELRQVLVNLVANALDAMPSGGRLIARVRPASDPTTNTSGVRLVIADTGSGMSPRTQRALFEPFYTTKGATGTGLGLWVSSQIVGRHKGRIRVRSSQSPEHHGTVFSIFLPNLSENPGNEVHHTALPSQQRPLPIDSKITSHEDASRHTPSQSDPPSTAYSAA